MKTGIKSALYIGLVFAIGWTVLIGGWLLGHDSPPENGLFLLAFAASPGLAAIFCTLAFERGRRTDALGLTFRPNIWWLWAALIPLFVAIATIVITAWLSPYNIANIGSTIIQASEILSFSADRGMLGLTSMLALSLLQNALLFSLTEELGWRGYLYGLWRPCGFWSTSLATGFIWGVWHWPMIYLYGLNYPNAPIIGMVVFPISTMLTSCLMTIIRDRSGSVWAAGIMHGAMNTFSLLFLFSIGDIGWPWGVAGIGGVLATAATATAVWHLQSNNPGHAERS